MNNLEQYDEAIRYWRESIALAKPEGQAPDDFFILDHYDFLAITLFHLKRLQESLSYANSIQIELNPLLPYN